MAKLISAALEGQHIYKNKAYFFKGDQYVGYDWGMDRVASGYPGNCSAWKLPPGFASGFDTALNGQKGYLDKAYFFKGAEYVRYDWKTDSLDPSTTAPISAWKLPVRFSVGIDAAINGDKQFAGKAYFFRGPEYVRYDWNQERVDPDYPKQIAEGFPGVFAGGVDAAVNGAGAYAGKAYFFKDDQYVRYDWAADRVDLGPRKIVGAWQGVVELLLAGEARSKALEWLVAAIRQLEAYRTTLATGGTFADASFLALALQTHFRFPPGLSDAAMVAHLDMVLPNFRAVQDAIVRRVPEIFRYGTEIENHQDGRSIIQRDAAGAPVLDASGRPIPILDAEGKHQPDAAAYTRFNDSITFTKLYPTKDKACRAAQIIHEVVHFVDSNNAEPNDVPEWYVTAPAATALGLTFQASHPTTKIIARYDSLPLNVAIHNPSSYSAFAQHARYREDTRYGELRQDVWKGNW